MKNLIHRTIHPVVRVTDEKAGIVEYVASDETLDSYREVIRADGWRFDQFRKNAPFVDSHDCSTIMNQVGVVLDYRVSGRQLIETVKWAVDVAENKLAQLGFAMTKGGYLKAVSVGFIPERFVTKWDSDPKPWQAALKDLGMHEEDGVRCIYICQQQKELSACILGANPNALAVEVAKAYKAGVLDDAALDTLSSAHSQRKTDNPADGPAAAALSRQRARQEFLEKIDKITKKL